MNKIFASALLAVAMIVPSVSLASSCDIDHPCGNGNPEQVVSAWGTTNSGVPHIMPGQRSASGDLCPAWFTNYCVDISQTAYYKSLFR